MEKMNVYLRAAEEIAQFDYHSCNQIESSGGTRKQRDRYATLFCPDGRAANSAWLHKLTSNGVTIIKAPIARLDRKKFRVLALCFMAAIVSYRRKRK
jgi:hypothetical protein